MTVKEDSIALRNQTNHSNQLPPPSHLHLSNQSLPVDRNLIIEYVTRWGCSNAGVLLDPACSIFTTQGIEGFIGYRDEAKCVVVYGDPACDAKDIPALTMDFHRHCEKLGKSVVYIVTLKPFTEWALQNVCSISIEFGMELTINPQNDPREREGVNARVVRSKVRQAERIGITVLEYLGNNPSLEKEMEDVAATWLAERKGPQVYIGNICLFDDRIGKRWFYAKLENKVIGIVVLNQLNKFDGWFLNRLITVHAPNGTSELLITTVLDILKKEGCEYLSFGPVPSNKLGEIKGLSGIPAWLARKGYLLAYHFLNLDGRKKFWDKYNPCSEPCYLMFGGKTIGVKELSGLIHALNVSL